MRSLLVLDQAIVESSGLVADGGRFVTTNDSGDTGRIFTVDDSGDTVGVTSWSDDPVDVEALAPADPGHVWVGDIGDNSATRPDVTVTRVSVGPGDRTETAPAYRLVYEGGPRDAEALLAAPTRLDPARDNRLTPVGNVTGLVTDGAFFPDGRHLVLRTYTTALVYSFPDLELVGEVRLPAQQQGEGLAVVGEDTLYLSSEGVNSPLLTMTLPTEVVRAMAPTSSTPAPASASVAPATTPSAEPREPGEPQRSPWPWLVGLGVMALLVITLLRALRPR